MTETVLSRICAGLLACCLACGGMPVPGFGFLSVSFCAAQDLDTKPESAAAPSLTEPIGDVATPLDDLVTPEAVAQAAFGPPPGAKQISKANLWVDRKQGRVYFDGYIAMRDGPLEMFACPMHTKEHESVISSLPMPREVHAALLAIGAKPGSPVQFRPKFKPASGQRIRVWVCWRDLPGKFHVTDARRLVQKAGTKEHMKSEWVFAGSSFWADPQTGRKRYSADTGDMICVSNFSSAMLDVNVASSAEADQLLYNPFTERIPPRYTSVRVILVPLPEDDGGDDKPADGKPDPNRMPTEAVLPKPS